MGIDQMTREQFEALPIAKWDEVIDCDCIVLLPSQSETDLHDSGYRFIEYALVKGDVAFCRKGAGDVLHLDGIGGYGQNWLEKFGTIPRVVLPSAWTIDCLPKSGLFCLWPMSRKMQCDASLSSLEVYALPRDKHPEAQP